MTATLLAIDTATLTAGAAVWANGRVLAERRRIVTRHSESLLALIDETLREAAVEPRALDAIVCGAGPGSFTGLRIGLSTAKGFCFALGRPLVLVSSLAALAARAPDGRVCAILDAHKDEVYAGLFAVEDGVPRALSPERVLAPSALAEELRGANVGLLGDGALRYRALFDIAPLDEDGAPRPGDVARLGALRFAAGERADLASSGPTYIRPSEAELMKLKR
ncbi:MAG TPA: tRNA (adenosine(37)-N6)-threonylcarbamoyltransferase complex dimerization subunit type 1 TsaB [Polyangia bacterium]|nr:tRNA (adenosine(37)-N6)-threonylcarbamoyltransferase complex dimerization subunit type 1 TsaB [Polyangia bacterium]